MEITVDSPETDLTKPEFTFSESDYIAEPTGVDSKFDQILKKQWSTAMDNGVMHFVIKHSSLKTRILSPNRYLFVAALNQGRAPNQRRDPQSMQSLVMPFDSNKFNFTKIKPCEVLFSIRSIAIPSLDAVVIVNRSPIEYCSALLVPSIDKCLPQVLTEESLHLAISVLCLSDNQSLRLGFNSLGAMASVNHLHWHLYYLEYKLAIESLPIKNHLLQNWPIPTIVFEISEHNDYAINTVVQKTMKIIKFCLDSGQIGHNLFLTRTSSGTIRLCIWLIEARFGAKNSIYINPAFCEFSGYFICKTEQMFDSIDELTCLHSIQSIRSHHAKVSHLL